MPIYAALVEKNKKKEEEEDNREHAQNFSLSNMWQHCVNSDRELLTHIYSNIIDQCCLFPHDNDDQ